jgi:hypothetical protein
LQTWIGRLGLAGAERRTYRTSVLDGDNAYRPDPGTEKASTRQYTVQECRDKIAEILAEDERLALRISRTNQQARAEIVDLSGQPRVLSIPELLVLKDDTIPKLEQAARAVPLRADDVSVYATGDAWVRYRQVKKVERKKESFSDKGLKVEEIELLGYDVVEVTDYGVPRREQWDIIEPFSSWSERVGHHLVTVRRVATGHEEAPVSELVDQDSLHATTRGFRCFSTVPRCRCLPGP